MSTNFNPEKAFLKRVEDDNGNNPREILTDTQINCLLEKYPNLPEDYILYLQEIGAGTFRECRFMVYASLIGLEDLGLEDDYELLKPTIKFFGDNFCGDFSGFDFEGNDGLVIEFWHETGEIYRTGQTFQNYIREQIY